MTEEDKKNVRDALNTNLKPYLRGQGVRGKRADPIDRRGPTIYSQLKRPRRCN
jgi:hypothetical protein